jgi:hypothetical protein
MQPSGKLLQFATASCIAVLLFALSLLATFGQARPPEAQTGQGMALQPPAFLKSAQAASPSQVDFGSILEEAGVTAYTKLDKEIDLVNAAARFKTIQQETDQFIVGIVTAPGYERSTELEENAEVNVFLQRDGWIVAYLSRWQLASAQFDWINYDKDRLTGTLIENVVRMFAEDEGVSDYTVSYYDFRNPEATHLILAADRVDVTTWADWFQITIPRELMVYESSWAHAKFDRSANESFCKLDNEELVRLNAPDEKWAYTNGELSPAKLSLGTTHRLELSVDGNWWNSESTRIYCGIAVVYGERP